jgi:hypothetical protein
MDLGRRQAGEELHECATQQWFEQAIVCHREHPGTYDFLILYYQLISFF